MYDTIIIGAGMSGLAAGIRLAYYSQRVCILERHTTIGGLNSFYRVNGRDFDVGLHAVTNYAPRGAKQGPLLRILRQLRLTWDDLALSPQHGSSIVFPGMSLDFSNDFELFRSEVGRCFPSQKDGFERFVQALPSYDQLGLPESRGSAREFLKRYISDPLLGEAIFCPVLYYGSASERDLDLGQFAVMFRSIFLEGLARPLAGIRLILKKLVRKFKDLGGELRLRAGVRRIFASDDRATRLVLDDGQELEARNILSSAGWRETMRLCEQPSSASPPPGRLSFVESISVLDRAPASVGLKRTAVFFNDSPVFDYSRPEGFVDLRSGVICSPNNFGYDEPLADGQIRITSLANHERWASLDPEAYRLEKLRWYDKMVASAVRFVPDFRSAVVDTDVFTPTTIRRFTGHENGAVYGSPKKRFDGTTHLKNLFLCGTDQGLVGIIGAILSGITVANRHLLR
jgi:phytoene dehydrogenase-like protein